MPAPMTMSRSRSAFSSWRRARKHTSAADNRDGTQLHLTPIEWQILSTLLSSAGKTLTHQQIFDAVWGRQFGSPQQYLRVHITNLRRKIEVDPAAPQIIITEPGVGYRAELSR